MLFALSAIAALAAAQVRIPDDAPSCPTTEPLVITDPHGAFEVNGWGPSDVWTCVLVYDFRDLALATEPEALLTDFDVYFRISGTASSSQHSSRFYERSFNRGGSSRSIGTSGTVSGSLYGTLMIELRSSSTSATATHTVTWDLRYNGVHVSAAENDLTVGEGGVHLLAPPGGDEWAHSFFDVTSEMLEMSLGVVEIMLPSVHTFNGGTYYARRGAEPGTTVFDAKVSVPAQGDTYVDQGDYSMTVEVTSPVRVWVSLLGDNAIGGYAWTLPRYLDANATIEDVIGPLEAKTFVVDASSVQEDLYATCYPGSANQYFKFHVSEDMHPGIGGTTGDRAPVYNSRFTGAPSLRLSGGEERGLLRLRVDYDFGAVGTTARDGDAPFLCEMIGCDFNSTAAYPF